MEVLARSGFGPAPPRPPCPWQCLSKRQWEQAIMTWRAELRRQHAERRTQEGARTQTQPGGGGHSPEDASAYPAPPAAEVMMGTSQAASVWVQLHPSREFAKGAEVRTRTGNSPGNSHRNSAAGNRTAGASCMHARTSPLAQPDWPESACASPRRLWRGALRSAARPEVWTSTTANSRGCGHHVHCADVVGQSLWPPTSGTSSSRSVTGTTTSLSKSTKNEGAWCRRKTSTQGDTVRGPPVM